MGLKGERGETYLGAKGERGDYGFIGPKGDKGECGLVGIVGDEGIPGRPGSKGIIGNFGPNGLRVSFFILFQYLTNKKLIINRDQMETVACQEILAVMV